MCNEVENKLCENQDCLRYPDDEDFDKDNEKDYENGQWKKCSLCDGYFNDDGLNDILFIEEEPNNNRSSCTLCGKNRNIVQMKDTGEYLCGNGCDGDTDEDIGYCSSCNIRLDNTRDGTEEDGHRCHNCYWEEEGPRMRKKDVSKLIFPDYRIIN